MSSLPKISIIVPVYNVEKYLQRCLDSIIAQTFTDWECICIDDGSPDNSGKILDEYAAKDNRFVIIHKENGGVSSARNAGLDIARGRYIGFVDSDDWIECNMYECLYNDILETGADVVICGFFGQKCKNKPTVYGVEEAQKLLFLPNGFGGFSCLRLLVAERIQNVRYDTSIEYLEDTKFFYEVFNNCNKIYWNPNPLYHYEENYTSVTKQRGLSHAARTALKAFEDMIDLEPDSSRKRFLAVSYVDFCIDIAVHYLNGYVEIDDSFDILKSVIFQNILKYIFCGYFTFRRKCLTIIICNSTLRNFYMKIRSLKKK